MRNAEYNKMVKDHYEEARKLANIGKEIIETIMLQRGKDMTQTDLYGDSDDPDWVWLDGNVRLQEIQLYPDNSIVLCGLEVWDENKEIRLDCASRDDIIEVANYLSQMEG